MDASQIDALVRSLDSKSTSAADEAWELLRPIGAAVVPHLLAFYPRARTWQGRTALVFHAIRYARTSEAAFELGALALRDRSYMVRYRACGLLAYSLRTEARAMLEPLLNHTDARTVEDAVAAIDAISSSNHNYFVDRTHSGRSFWVVNETDRQH